MNADAEKWLEDYYHVHLRPTMDDDPSMQAIEDALRAAMEWAYRDAVKICFSIPCPLGSDLVSAAARTMNKDCRRTIEARLK